MADASLYYCLEELEKIAFLPAAGQALRSSVGQMAAGAVPGAVAGGIAGAAGGEVIGDSPVLGGLMGAATGALAGAAGGRMLGSRLQQAAAARNARVARGVDASVPVHPDHLDVLRQRSGGGAALASAVDDYLASGSKASTKYRNMQYQKAMDTDQGLLFPQFPGVSAALRSAEQRLYPEAFSQAPAYVRANNTLPIKVS